MSLNIDLYDIKAGKFDQHILRNPNVVEALFDRLAFKKSQEEGDRIVSLLKQELKHGDSLIYPEALKIGMRNDLIYLKSFKIFNNERRGSNVFHGFRAVFESFNFTKIIMTRARSRRINICKITIEEDGEVIFSKRLHEFDLYENISPKEEFADEDVEDNSKECIYDFFSHDEEGFQDIVFCVQKVEIIDKEINYENFRRRKDLYEYENIEFCIQRALRVVNQNEIRRTKEKIARDPKYMDYLEMRSYDEEYGNVEYKNNEELKPLGQKLSKLINCERLEFIEFFNFEGKKLINVVFKLASVTFAFLHLKPGDRVFKIFVSGNAFSEDFEIGEDMDFNNTGIVSPLRPYIKNFIKAIQNLKNEDLVFPGNSGYIYKN